MLACLLCGANSGSAMPSPLHSAHVEAHESIIPSCGVYCFLVGGAVANVNPFFLRAAALLPHGLRFAN